MNAGYTKSKQFIEHLITIIQTVSSML